MKIKLWSKYFIYIVLIIVVVFLGQHVIESVKKNAETTFDINLNFQNALMIIFYGGIGLLLGLEHLVCEMKKEGKWKINFPKLVLMGIPSLYFSLTFFLYYSNNQFVQDILSYPIILLLNTSTSFLSVFQLIFGYSVITSFYKYNGKI